MKFQAAAVAALVAASADAYFNCKVEKDGLKFDLSKLEGYFSVPSHENTPPSERSYSWHINPCGALDLSKIKSKEERCPKGTQICGVEHTSLKSEDEDAKPLLTGVIPVAGDIDGNQGQVKTHIIDSDAGGLAVQFAGGKWGDRTKLKATIDFICSKDETDEGSLEFVSWNTTNLHLTWLTDAACASSKGGNDNDGGKDGDEGKDKDKDGNDNGKGDNGDGNGSDGNGSDENGGKDEQKKASWGFFTWIFIIAVLLFGGYVIASAWVNYNRYGMSGVDVLPHSDTVRDLPFLVRDFVNKIVNTFAGGNRGGYSAV